MGDFVPGQEYFLTLALGALYLDVEPVVLGIHAVQVISQVQRSDAPDAPPESLEVGLGTVFCVEFYCAADRGFPQESLLPWRTGIKCAGRSGAGQYPAGILQQCR